MFANTVSVLEPWSIGFPRGAARAIGIDHGTTCFGMWLPTESPLSVFKKDGPKKQSSQLIVSPVPVQGWPRSFQIDACLRFSHSDASSDTTAGAILRADRVPTVLADFLQCLSQYKGRFASGPRSWTVGAPNMVSGRLVNVGWTHRLLRVNAEFREWKDTATDAASNLWAGLSREERKNALQTHLQHVGRVMLPAMSSLRRYLINEAGDSFYKRVADEGDSPYYLTEGDFSGTGLDVDHQLFETCKTAPLQVRPLMHLCKYRLVAADAGEFPFEISNRFSQLREIDPTLNGLAVHIFIYNAQTQRLVAHRTQTDQPSIVDVLNCGISESAKHNEDNLFHDSADKTNVAIGAVTEREACVRFRFIRPSVAANLCFVASIPYEIPRNIAGGLLSDLSKVLRNKGFRFQQLEFSAGFDGLIEKGRIFAVLQLLNGEPEAGSLKNCVDVNDVSEALSEAFRELRKQPPWHDGAKSLLKLGLGDEPIVSLRNWVLNAPYGAVR